MKATRTNPARRVPQVLTKTQRKHLDRLKAMPDESIDTSDIPELSDEAWREGVRGRFGGSI